MIKNLLLLGCIATMIACTPTKQPTIDTTLQSKVDSILQNKMSEINAISGQAIVMEVQKGEIKAMVGNGKKQSSSLMRAVSIDKALDTDKVLLSDSVDTENGVVILNGDTILDHNWHRGGYGKLTTLQGLMVNSHIANYKNIERAFTEEQVYLDMLNKMCYGQPESIVRIDDLRPAHFVTPNDSGWNNTSLAWFCIGYNQRISPIQMLTFYNTLANNGKYSIIVSVNKIGFPASGGLMAGSIFREIVDCIIK